MIKPIITYPNKILRKKTKTVTDFNDDLRTLVNDLTETMFDAPGAGLAANQIGVSKQVVVVNISKKDDDADRKAIALINPQIIEAEDSQTETEVEGCLSVIDYTSKVKRFTKIKVIAQDLSGKKIEFEAEDFFARVIQHESDHLIGKLFIDRISSLKRALYKNKLKKILREENSNDEVR